MHDEETPFGDQEWFDVAGPRDAPAIVFLHGVRLNRRMWAPQLAALGDTYRVIAPDLPGHGALHPVAFELETAAAVIAYLISREAAGRALVVGLSLGGYTALELARQRPEMVAGLVLSGCSVNLRGLLAWPYRLAGLLARLLPEGMLAGLSAALLRRGVPREQAERVARIGFAADVIPEAVSQVVGVDFVPLVRSYPGPILFLNGRHDRVFRRGEDAFVAAANEGRLQILSGAGHLCSLQQPEAFSTAVRRFAQSIGWK